MGVISDKPKSMDAQHFIEHDAGLIALASVIGFVGFWCLITWILSLISGWSALSKQFRLVGPFDGVSDGMQSGRMRWGVNYGNCLRLGANGQGLYLATLFLFRPGHPPLLIPWSQIRITEKQHWLLGKCVTVTLGRESGIPLQIRGTTAELLRESAGSHWPVEETRI